MKILILMLGIVMVLVINGCDKYDCPDWASCNQEDGIICREITDYSICCDYDNQECLERLECGYTCITDSINSFEEQGGYETNKGW